MEQARIRNFCIIAHIDHGKSTLADRLLEATGTLAAREMGEQVLDQMELEREKGVTIKAKAVRLLYRARDGLDYELNLIDTPGHVDFAYEVSRALAACEGALLVVDAVQGVQAQTMANVYAALEHDLTVVPIINKIDLPNADPQGVAADLAGALGFPAQETIYASAKEGVGTEEVLEAVVLRVPPPRGAETAPLRALIFDSKYDSYKGVLAYVRVMEGEMPQDRRLRLMATGIAVEPLEVGVFRPAFSPIGALTTGEVGYVATGLKNVKDCEVGDTLTDLESPAAEPLEGYRPAKSMVFVGLYPVQPNDYGLLRDALDKFKLNDASLSYQPESSAALGFGFRCGFLGLLHMEIVQERLEREYGLSLLATAPSVEYVVLKTDGNELVVDNPADLPPPNEMAEIREPWMKVSVITPDRYLGAIMELATGRRGEYRRMEYLQAAGNKLQATGNKEQATSTRGEFASGESNRQQATGREGLVTLEYRFPLSEILVDFYDQLKSRSQGYASMDYAFSHYAAAKLVKLDVLVNYQPVDALSLITNAEKANAQGRALVDKLRRLIPRQLFDVPIQAAVGHHVVARETIRAMRKNVLAKCYGGDVTRKRKLLEKQAEGKKRMKRIGNVEIPQEAFMAVLRLDK